MDQVVQVAGSLLILSAFVGAQSGRINTKSWLYLVVNLVGSATLAVDALLHAQWGFLLLEGSWAVVSALGIVLLARGRDAVAATH